MGANFRELHYGEVRRITLLGTSVNPWQPQGIEIRGEAEILPSGGKALGPGFAPEMFRIRPRRIVSWGIMENMVPVGRSVA
jgi:hypothetical protein